MIGTKPSPCLQIRWSAGAVKLKAEARPSCSRAASGTCYSPESAPQGTAIVVQAEPKVSAQ